MYRYVKNVADDCFISDLYHPLELLNFDKSDVSTYAVKIRRSFEW